MWNLEETFKRDTKRKVSANSLALKQLPLARATRSWFVLDAERLLTSQTIRAWLQGLQAFEAATMRGNGAAVPEGVISPTGRIQTTRYCCSCEVFWHWGRPHCSLSGTLTNALTHKIAAQPAKWGLVLSWYCTPTQPTNYPVTESLSCVLHYMRRYYSHKDDLGHPPPPNMEQRDAGSHVCSSRFHHCAHNDVTDDQVGFWSKKANFFSCEFEHGDEHDINRNLFSCLPEAQKDTF